MRSSSLSSPALVMPAFHTVAAPSASDALRARGPRMIRAAQPDRAWRVVGAAFLVATFGWGVGFYGPGVYLVALHARNGWSTAGISSAITAYYILSATWICFFAGPVFERYGARRVVSAGALLLAGGAMLLGLASRPWHVLAAFALMSPGWAATSGAAVNIIVAPWFDARRGLAVSLALNGASVAGIFIPPLLIFLVARFGFALALVLAFVPFLVLLLAVVALVLRPRHAAAPASMGRGGDAPVSLAAMLRSARFLTITIAFALGLTAQVGLLTHQLALLSPALGTIGAAWAVSVTTVTAVLSRVVCGFVIDRFDRRAGAAANFLVQALGIALLLAAQPRLLLLGCVLFGIGVGNMITLPSLIVQGEFAAAQFARVASLVFGIDQFAFAFGPGLLGQLAQARGGYDAALVLCLAMDVAGALVILAPRLRAGGGFRRR